MEERKESFFPSGAVSFFIFLLGFYVFLWLMVYALLISFSE